MKYYTLSFRNKILLALILILVACLGVIFGKTFNDNNTITADAADYTNNITLDNYDGTPSAINDTVKSAYDWIEEYYHTGVLHEIPSVTLIKFYDYSGSLVYGSYFTTYALSDVYTPKQSGSGYTSSSITNTAGITNTRDAISDFKIATMVSNAANLMTDHNSGTIYHTTYNSPAESKTGTSLAYKTGYGLMLDFSCLEKALLTGSITGTTSSAFNYTYTVRTYGASGWSSTTSYSSLSSLLYGYSVPNSYEGVYYGSGGASWTCSHVDGGQTTLMGAGQIIDPTATNKGNDKSSTGCYVNRNAWDEATTTYDNFYNIRVVEVKASRTQIYNVEYDYYGGSKLYYYGVGTNFSPHSESATTPAGWEFTGWSLYSDRYVPVTNVHVDSYTSSNLKWTFTWYYYTNLYSDTLFNPTSNSSETEDRRDGNILHLYAWYKKDATVNFYQCTGTYANGTMSYGSTETVWAHNTTCSEAYAYEVTMPAITTITNATINYPDIVGWYASESGGSLYSVGNTVILSGSASFYASLSRTDMATFELNGAASLEWYSQTGTAKIIANEKGSYHAFGDSSTKDPSASILAPNITRSGWECLGFNTSASATKATVGQHSYVSSGKYYAITSRTVVYRFYQVNGGYSDVSHTFYNTGTTASVTAPTVSAKTISGYYFSDIVGWGDSNSATSALRVWE